MLDNKVLITIYRQKVELVHKNQKFDVAFNPEEIKNLEVLNNSKFKSSIKDFLVKTKLRNPKVYILLSEEVLFVKEILPAESKDLERLTDDFLAEVPIIQSKIIKKVFNLGNSFLIVVTTKDIYEPIIQVLNEINWHLTGLYPVEVLKRLGINTENINLAEIQKKSKSDISMLFIEKSHKKIKPLYILIAAAIALILVGLGFFALKMLKTSKSTQESPVLETTSSLEVQNESTQSTQTSTSLNSLSFINKENLKINILNGSNIPGLATKIKLSMEEADFTNIQVGNSTEVNQNNTLVQFKSSVSPEIKEEIIKFLTQEFEEIDSAEDNSMDFDVQIVTGS